MPSSRIRPLATAVAAPLHPALSLASCLVLLMVAPLAYPLSVSSHLCQFLVRKSEAYDANPFKDKDSLLPRSEYMHVDVVAYIIHTYIHIHKYTYLHTYILTHKVNLGMQSLKYHKTPSLKICILVCKKYILK